MFKKDQYGVAKCHLCGAVGTIVEMGLCCKIKRMADAETAAANAHDTERKVA